MGLPGLTIENLLHEKVLLYRDLLDILEQEKKSIQEIDIDSLWKISRRKQEIASEIETARGKILDALKHASISHDMDMESFEIPKILAALPEDVNERLRKVNVTLLSIKDDIQGLLRENKQFVGEYLNVLDELIGIITDSGSREPVYGRDRHPAKTGANLLLHREV